MKQTLSGADITKLQSRLVELRGIAQSNPDAIIETGIGPTGRANVLVLIRETKKLLGVYIRVSDQPEDDPKR